jgi:hypothetical protein
MKAGMCTLSTRPLKVMASAYALFVMIEPVAIRAQTIGDHDRASDKSQSVEGARSESVPNVEAGALKIRDWRVTQANELLWTSSRQSRPGPWSRPLKTTGAKLKGFIVGSSIGAVVGATIGVALIR